MCIGIRVHVCVILYHRRYFGEKVGIYFTWIGFYTTWLLPISLLGIVIFLYGLSTIPLYRNAVAYVVIYISNVYVILCSGQDFEKLQSLVSM